jgi:hypothetical protein
VKFFPIALREALREEPALRAARGLTVRLLDETEAPLIDLDPWVLLNLKIDDVVRLQNDIVEQFSISVEVTTDALSSYAIQHIGLLDFYRKFMPSISESPVVMVPSTRHYSWPKAATILGLGQNNVLRVGVDCQARMDIDALMPLLEECLERRTPVLSVVAVIGSTEESAVDPLCRILAVRDDFRKRGLDFAIHCDAAWGGYFSSMLRNDLNGRLIDAVPVYPMSDYVIQQYDALRNADSITVDPHKAGYVPYPAGGLCYRNSALRDQVSLAAPIVFHSQLEPTVGIYGIEGSKPGAAAAAVYLAHQVIRPSQSGYGKILGNCMWTSKRMYARLITMGDQRITITFLQQLPAELANEKPAVIEAQKAYIGENFVNCTNEQLWHLLEDPRASKLFKDIGSDQVILSYAFNFFDGDGNLNTDLTKANMLNDSVFNVCSVTKPPTSMADLNKLKVIVTESSFDPAIYGQPFVDRFARRMGVATSPGVPVKFLISTTMDPWTTEAPPTPENQSGDFQAVIADALMSAAHQALHSLKFGPDRASETSQ